MTSGPHIFPPFEEIEERLLYVVYTWNARRSTTTDKAVESAAQFFFDVVNLHPFVDGNGRLSRLLASHVIRQLGLPIPLRIDNGLKTGREDYLHAVTERSGRAIRELIAVDERYVNCSLLRSVLLPNIEPSQTRLSEWKVVAPEFSLTDKSTWLCKKCL